MGGMWVPGVIIRREILITWYRVCYNRVSGLSLLIQVLVVPLIVLLQPISRIFAESFFFSFLCFFFNRLSVDPR